MKKSRLLLMLLLGSIIINPLQTAGQDKAVQKRMVKKITARKVIKKTAVLILRAYKIVKENKVYTGNLARAISHQKYAKKLYLGKVFNGAVYHSLRARKLALLAIKANRKEGPSEIKKDQEENAITLEMPPDDDLDKTLKQELPSETEKDEDVLSSSPDVNVD
ncbi:MAG: hypothetical protein PHF84_06360 [bacterium]|nr:hypothetical protein [bacterium]